VSGPWLRAAARRRTCLASSVPAPRDFQWRSTHAVHCALFGLLLVGAGAHALADEARDASASTRAVADATLRQQEAECNRRFTAASCLDAARDQHRVVVRRLHDEALERDQARRSEAAQHRRTVIDDRQRAAAARGPASAAASRGAGPSAAASDAASDSRAEPLARDGPRMQKPSTNDAPHLRWSAGKPPSVDHGRTAREAESTARFESKQRSAAEHRAAVAARNAGRNAARALPLPAVSSPAAARPAGSSPAG
jgi:hypothetical protein